MIQCGGVVVFSVFLCALPLRSTAVGVKWLPLCVCVCLYCF